MAWHKQRLATTGFWTASAILALGAALGGFWIARAGVPHHTSMPTPTVTPTPVTSLAPGTYRYSALLTGTCLSAFPGTWEVTYDVVPCALPHSAQVIRVGQVPGYSASAYPGEARVQATVLPLCTEPGVILPSGSQGANNTVITVSFPVSAIEWRETRGTFVCYASTTDGSKLSGSLVATG
ncbi:MAG: hypothetical protein EBR52_05600 [Microbacteriaceae bacterium]|nr:hypothetical protein [Microbacteriaceae bacterium]